MNTTTTTLAYYNDNADAFVQGTVSVDFKALQDRFLATLPPHAHVLDVGCGSGRDSLAFKNAGCTVTAIDGSEAICKHASRLIGQEVICTRFTDYTPQEVFDGIWACASLLHLEWNDLLRVMETLSRALRTEGTFYASFKLGNASEMRAGRFFTDMTEERLDELLAHLPALALSETFLTGDARPDRVHEKWLNVILKKI